MDTSLLHNISEGDIEKFKLIAEIFNQTNKIEVVTLRVFADEYSNFIKQNRSAAYHTSVTISLNHLTNFFGKQRSIQSLSLKDLENFITDLQQKVKKGYRVYYKTLKAAFNKAIEWDYLKENNFLKVKLSKKQKVNPAFLNGDQLSVICDRLENEVVKDIVVFGFYTGMRLNEIINLTWRNVDLTGRVITVGDEKFTTKGRNQRYVPICKEALTSVLSQRERKTEIPIGNTYVFCKANGKAFTGDYVSKKFKRACRAAGIDSAIHFHSLRHSFASNLAQKGVSLYVIKELLGHSSISTTEIYSHLNMDSLREAIGKFDGPHSKSLSLVRRETFNIKFSEKNGGL
ncbi:MAG: tyrosine-type recombinase/integrase [Melioribacteraceae bacterium]